MKIRAVALSVGIASVFTTLCVVLVAQDKVAQDFSPAPGAKTTKTVNDAVYSEAQAVRGGLAYDASCSGCHRVDLGGADGPMLRGERFAKNFAGRDLNTLYTKIATTMPRGAPGSLGDAVYLDIVAYILRENGFPAGEAALSAEQLSTLQIVPGRPKPPPPVGDFSYVEVVGCLTAGPDNTWLLSNASEPVSLVATAAARGEATNKPLGTQVFRLFDALAYNPEARKGQKMYVRGLLIKLPDEQRMTISALETLAPTCN